MLHRRLALNLVLKLVENRCVASDLTNKTKKKLKLKLKLKQSKSNRKNKLDTIEKENAQQKDRVWVIDVPIAPGCCVSMALDVAAHGCRSPIQQQERLSVNATMFVGRQ